MPEPRHSGKPSQPKQGQQGPSYRPFGRVTGAFGVRGYAKVQPLTDFLDRFSVGTRVRIGEIDSEIEDVQVQHERLVVKFRGLDTPEKVREFSGVTVEGFVEGPPEMGDDEYLTDDLLGLTAKTTEGLVIGVVTDVLSLPAHDVICIGDVMVPAVKEFVKDVDLDTGTITLAVIQGMLPEEA